MKKGKINNSNIFFGLSTLIVIAVLGIYALSPNNVFCRDNMGHDDDRDMAMDGRNMEIGSVDMQDMGMEITQFISTKGNIQQNMKNQHMYRCCLEKPCMYCIEKTPKHGEGAACDCLSDIMNGVHPCGECIGEILEGHGNPYLAEYFAKAIAEEVGEQHLATLKQIISEKYDISIEEQA